MNECCNRPLIPGECWYDHFERFFGTPSRRWRFAQNDHDPVIQILAFEDVFPGATVFCSVGFSHYVPEVQQCAEVYLPVDDGFDRVPYIFASALFFLVQSRIRFGRGTNVKGLELIDSDFVEQFKKDTLYFTTPQGLPDDFGVVHHGDSRGVVGLAAFVSPEEREFLYARGSSEFEDVLEAKDVDLIDIKRPSAI